MATLPANLLNQLQAGASKGGILCNLLDANARKLIQFIEDLIDYPELVIEKLNEIAKLIENLANSEIDAAANEVNDILDLLNPKINNLVNPIGALASCPYIENDPRLKKMYEDTKNAIDAQLAAKDTAPIQAAKDTVDSVRSSLQKVVHDAFDRNIYGKMQQLIEQYEKFLTRNKIRDAVVTLSQIEQCIRAMCDTIQATGDDIQAIKDKLAVDDQGNCNWEEKTKAQASQDGQNNWDYAKNSYTSTHSKVNTTGNSISDSFPKTPDFSVS